MKGPTLGHVHLRVSNLERAEEFYTGVLGLKVSERVGESYVFLSAGTKHHDLALQSADPQAPAPLPGSLGLYHIAFEVPDLPGLAQVYQALLARAIPVRAVDHGISLALYFEDPDGNGVEVYVDTRSNGDLWGGHSTPMDEAALLRDFPEE